MLTEQEMINKLKEYGCLFNLFVKNKEWGKAHNIYRQTLTVAVFMEAPPLVMDELFGAYPEEDETAPDTAGIICRKDVARVDLECCIRRNMAYEDMALRKQGREPEYYSDINYCARCQIKKHPGRPQLRRDR